MRLRFQFYLQCRRKYPDSLYDSIRDIDYNLSFIVESYNIGNGPPGGLPPFGIPVATLGIRLPLLHIRLVLCSPVPSVVALGCSSFCRCPFSVGHPAG